MVKRRSKDTTYVDPSAVGVHKSDDIWSICTYSLSDTYYACAEICLAS